MTEEGALPATIASHRSGAKRGKWGRTVIGIVIVLVLLFPLYWMINASLQPSGALLRSNPDWFPVHGTFAGYTEALRGEGGNFVTSVIIALGTVVLSLLIGLPAAYALAQLRVRGGPVLLFALLIVQMIPGIVMANSLYTVFNDLDLIDSYTGLIIADSTATIPFAILVLRAFMITIPGDLSESARVDGAGYFRTFVSIILPISRNAVVTAGLFSFLFAWADFLFGVTLTTGSSIEPITVGIYKFIGNQTADWNGIMATAVLAAIPAAILLVIAQRYVVAGVTGGAIKE